MGNTNIYLSIVYLVFNTYYIFCYQVNEVYLVYDRLEAVWGEITYLAMQHMFSCKVSEIYEE